MKFGLFGAATAQRNANPDVDSAAGFACGAREAEVRQSKHPRLVLLWLESSAPRLAWGAAAGCFAFASDSMN